MDQEGQYPLTQEFQKILLSSAPSTLVSAIDAGNISSKSGTFSASDESTFDLDPQVFDKWVPFLRTSVENKNLESATDELCSSVDDNFDGLETQLLQDAKLNDKLKNSIGQISKIQDIIDNSLLQEVNDLQENLTYSTNEVIMKKQAYVSNKKTSLKISEATILITKVLQILELSNKCQELIVEADFFKALQNLDSLEKIYLQDFKNYNFQFLKEIYDSIPFLKSAIKDECINKIKNSFNVNLGKNLSHVGEATFNVYSKELVPEWLEKKDTMKLGIFKFNSPVEISLRNESTLEKINLESFFHLNEFHDSILIFQSLNQQPYLISEFTKEYNFRKTKLIDPLLWKKSQKQTSNGNLDISSDPFAQQLNLESFKAYFLKLLGFLLYDINLNKSTDFILANNNYNSTNEFWDGLLKRLEPYLKYFLNEKLKSEQELVEFKDFMGIYISILENFKVNIEPLYNILISVFGSYCQLNILELQKEFEILLNDDDFMPLTINDRTLYEKVLKICWIKEDEITKIQESAMKQNGEFIVTLPFSPLYPMTYTLLKKTYSKLVHFIGSYYRHELHTLSNTLVKTMDTIFSKVINEKIRGKLDTTSREEIAQILVNLDYFVIAAKEFSALMSKENIMQNPAMEIKLSSIRSYAESRKYAETKLIQLIDSKVSDILETVELDWQASTARNDPDISIVDIAQFLEMMFSSTLVNLPYSVQTLLIFREFDSLTSQFLEILLHGTPTHLSQESVHNFEVDMKYLESIIPRIFPTTEDESSRNVGEIQSPLTVNSPSINGFGRSINSIENNIKSLQATFTELKQCIELLKNNNFEEYADPEVRPRKYPRVRPEDANLLIRKVQQSRMHTTSSLEEENNLLPYDDSQRDGSSSRIAKFFNRH
ncbi:hypothetical protein HG535_0G04870 [Zygotorulaspora mrakii]|uniref:Exocyst complex component SEC15 n=1 Tax=Zygotorulaspora mrakii TaxID=42260 RepID=A0A7H9B8M9_ZYGMR|nr:uncharacterized protein HG535_0G04870 [Zygotorulaspora mrakii]QLG74604.1 hypothetical protein HG535_0G04870 [Zygotorulaspora mrakii]